MYIPSHFQVDERAEIDAFIDANAFGQLISQLDGRLFSTHLPFLMTEDKQQLLCHLAKQNPQWKSVDGQEVLISLQGPHAYISPSWYKSPGVPTWNYQVVHVYGKCRTFADRDRLKTLVDALTHKYEAEQPTAWTPEYRANMLGAIVGIEVSITEVQCKYKLSQNRSAEDRESLIKTLTATGQSELAKAMS